MRAPSSRCSACKGVVCSSSEGADTAAPQGERPWYTPWAGPCCPLYLRDSPLARACSFGGPRPFGAASLQQGGAPLGGACQSWAPERCCAFGGSLRNALLTRRIVAVLFLRRAGVPDDRFVALELRRVELRELLGRAAPDFGTHAHELVVDLRVLQDLVHLGVQAHDDVVRRMGRQHQAVPGRGDHRHARLLEGRNV